MRIEIYPPDFSTRFELSHAISVQESVYYNDIGKIQIVAAADEHNIKAIRKNSIIYDVKNGTTYIIVDVECNTEENRITANGFTSEYLLNKRVIAGKKQITLIETGVYGIINDNLRGLPGIETAEVKGLPETWQPDDPETEDNESEVYGGRLLDKITPILEYGQLGRKMNWDPKELSWEFEIYKGQNLTEGIHAIVFSEEQGTCKNLKITEDSSNFANVAYCSYKTAENDRQIVTVGTAEGNDRFEAWIETSITQESGETDQKAKERAISAGQLELGKRMDRKTFEVEADTSELGRLYNIGDVVKCSSLRFGVSFNARITGAIYTMDATGERTELRLGDPILTALGELKLYGNS